VDGSVVGCVVAAKGAALCRMASSCYRASFQHWATIGRRSHFSRLALHSRDGPQRVHSGVCANFVVASPLILTLRLVLKMFPVWLSLLAMLACLFGVAIKRRVTGEVVANPRRIYVSMSVFSLLLGMHTWLGWCWHPGLLIVLVWAIRIVVPLVAVVAYTAVAIQIWRGRGRGHRRIDREVMIASALSTSIIAIVETVIHLW
jgi:hypothetical protein